MSLNERSHRNLAGVHEDLVRVVKRAAEIAAVPFIVTEGVRTLARQQELVAAGKSWTLDSRHLTGHAVDLCDADNAGYEMPDMIEIGRAMKQAASELGVPIEWGANVKYGGDWKTKNDSPHFELTRAAYPASGVTAATKAKEIAINVATSRPAITAAAATAATAVTSPETITAPPQELIDAVAGLGAWQALADTLMGHITLAINNPAQAVLVGVLMGAFIWFPQIKSYLPAITWRPQQ